MSEKVEQHQQQQQHMNNNNQRIHKSPEFQMSGMMPGGITRERSFVRTSNHQNINKRRSLAFNVQTGMQPNQMRTKPGMDIYRPPNIRLDGNSLNNNANNKLNIHAQEFTMNRAQQQQLQQQQQQQHQPGDPHNPRYEIFQGKQI